VKQRLRSSPEGADHREASLGKSEMVTQLRFKGGDRFSADKLASLGSLGGALPSVLRALCTVGPPGLLTCLLAGVALPGSRTPLEHPDVDLSMAATRQKPLKGSW